MPATTVKAALAVLQITRRHNRLQYGYAAGFTLIELLVVLIIISIITATTIFTATDGGRSRRMQAAVEQLKNAIELAQSQAILTQSVIGIEITPHTYQFILFTTQLDLKNHQLNPLWVSIADNPILQLQKLPSYMQLNIDVEAELFKDLQAKVNNTKALSPQAIILPSGSFTPFTLTLESSNKKTVYQLKGDSSGNVKVMRGNIELKE